MISHLSLCAPKFSSLVLPSEGRSAHAVCAKATKIGSPVKNLGRASVKGSSRSVNEDRFDYQYVTEDVEVGAINTYAAVFDGHGGFAVAERLEQLFRDEIQTYWNKYPPQAAVAKAFVDVDRKLLQRPSGFWGTFGERGVGGSRCGATGATAFIYKDEDGKQKLLAANIGDSRVVLIRKGTAVQLTEDHVPDMENERVRIEKENPNPRMPLVRYVEGTWRVGGLLALSRAFGDAYLKGNLQFEGIDAGSGYSTGFGVIADPYISVTELEKNDSWLLVHSDGLNNTSSRGGGGGLSNEEISSLCSKLGSKGAQQLAETLVKEAQKSGSTDDISVICLELDI